MTPPPSEEEIRHLKKLLLRKGAEINERLTRLLAGQHVTLESILSPKPGETPLERLRRFMALVDGSLQAIRAGSYGRCQRCGDGLPYAHLEQIPWIDTCQKCGAMEPTN